MFAVTNTPIVIGAASASSYGAVRWEHSRFRSFLEHPFGRLVW